MIDHSNWCLILTDGWCSCGARTEPPMTLSVCTGAYNCRADRHWESCYSQDVCGDPACEAEQPHISHAERSA